MVEFTTSLFLLCVILAVSLGIVFALRYVVIMERRIANIEMHIEKLSRAILREEKTLRSSLRRR